MNPEQTTRTSKFLSLVLRHQPETAHITLDTAGWVSVEDLLTGCAKARRTMSRADLDHIVATNAKKRFEFSPDGTRIRASQGHSVEVDLNYEPKPPPAILYHGTATRFLENIRTQGLLKMQRHHVHLAAETKMTMEVGGRHGKPVLLTILATKMHKAGHSFYLSTNNVWLVDHVPPQFIRFP
ncbi:RNA 2'-phosphotransferase [Prosthecobacter sp.]|uniref:RNA 2'-phosphotransferase n=1 Tax=Prosthecobacter sp. TaxID=1965333 RepID=UPI00378481CD